MSDNIKLVLITNVADSFGLYRGQIQFLTEHGFEVHLVSSPGRLLLETAQREKVAVHAVDMPRKMSPLADILAICRLSKLLKKIQPTIVHASFPKGGLIGVIAARLARVPHIIYGMRGLRFETSTGWRRQLLFSTEKISCTLADLVIANSYGNQKRAISLGLVNKPEKIRVLANGSSNGIDARDRFNPEKFSAAVRAELRSQYKVPTADCVIGFVGRLVRDKGITELAEAWHKLRKINDNISLVLVGPIESHDPLPAAVLEGLRSDKKVVFTGQVSDPAPFYTMMDITVLPSYREGFPNTPMEAAAMGLPVVATNIDGCSEAVLDEITGLLVPVHDSASLSRAIQSLIDNPGKRQELGEKGRQRMLEKFNPEGIWRNLYTIYQEQLSLA
jgi:glycosyltransferase involved in cell wall biosynthesis